MRAFLLVTIFLASTAFADVIVTKDGARHTGQILNETQRGYLFRGDDGATNVIEFNQIDEVSRGTVPSDAPVRVQLAPGFTVEQMMQMARLGELKVDRAENGFSTPIVFAILGTAAIVASIPALTQDYYYGRPANSVSVSLLVVGAAAFIPSAIVLAVRIVRRIGLAQDIEELERILLSQGVPLRKQ